MGDPELRQRAATEMQDSADRAFAQAVAAERSAIRAHIHAAVLHHQRAAQLDRMADLAHDNLRRDELLHQAETETTRGLAATGRADFARQRLIDEGETP